MDVQRQKFAALASALLALCATRLSVADPVISSYAFVRQDGSLQVSDHHIHLYGISVPPTAETCHPFGRPILCAPRASIALESKISENFIDCTPRATSPDGGLIAICTLNGEDLSAWMLENGWAVALSDAPVAYQALERAAQAKEMGIWGEPGDSLRRRRSR